MYPCPAPAVNRCGTPRPERTSAGQRAFERRPDDPQPRSLHPGRGWSGPSAAACSWNPQDSTSRPASNAKVRTGPPGRPRDFHPRCSTSTPIIIPVPRTSARSPRSVTMEISPCLQQGPDLLRVFDGPVLQDLDDAQRGGACHGVSAERPAVCARGPPRHQVGAPDHGGQRQAIGDSLGRRRARRASPRNARRRTCGRCGRTRSGFRQRPGRCRACRTAPARARRNSAGAGR